ncbi:MAG TPA: PAS domain-containing protein [Armatimonadota bacterium]|nr:PAS domain-containing protein [Armatimonadota bacterium]
MTRSDTRAPWLSHLQATLADPIVDTRCGWKDRRRRIEDLATTLEGAARVLHDLPAASFVADERLSLQLVNPALAELAGRDAEQIAGSLSVSDLLTAAEGEWHSMVVPCLGHGQVLRGIEAELAAPGQKAGRVSVDLGPLRDARGVVCGIVGTVRDVSAEREREREAADKAAWVKGILERIPDPFFQVDSNLTVTYMNPACAAAVGYDASEVVGKMRCADVFRSNICETNCAIKHCMRTGESITGARVTIQNRRGDRIPILCSAAALTDSQGQIIGGYELVSGHLSRGRG